MAKYAIKVPLGHDDDDRLFLTEGDSKFKLRIKTFNDIDSAREMADTCGPGAVVVELDDDFQIIL